MAAVYNDVMRRIQLYMDDDLDEQLGLEAARTGTSRSELVRQAVRVWLGTGKHQGDSLDEAVGSIDIDPVDDLDAVIYQR